MRSWRGACSSLSALQIGDIERIEFLLTDSPSSSWASGTAAAQPLRGLHKLKPRQDMSRLNFNKLLYVPDFD